MTEGFKIGGIDGHPLTHGAAMVPYLLYFSFADLGGIWSVHKQRTLAFFSILPSLASDFTNHSTPLSPWSLWRELSPRPLQLYWFSHKHSSTQDIGTVFGTFANEDMLTTKPRYIIHFTTLIPGPHRVPDTMEIFSKILQNAPKIVFTKVEVGVRN